jgi:CubicO group peptidase (beta-lactamase class C family)
LQQTVAGGAGYGLMLKDHNQTYPFQFHGGADDPVFYAALKDITSPGTSRQSKPPPPTSTYFPPSDTQGGWRTPANPEEARRVAGIDVAKLDDALAVAKASTKNGGVLVIRNGWLVYEKYFGLAHRDATPNLASCGKSFTSIAVGILMAERPDLFPDGLDQKVFHPTYMPPETFPLSDPAKAEIKLGQLLAFTAGIRGNNPCRVLGKEVTIDPPGPDGAVSMIDAVAHGRRSIQHKGQPTSAATLWCKPGEGYSYASSSAHLASLVVRHVAGMELEEYTRLRIATPLGWGKFTYGYKNSKEVTHTPGAGGIAVRATDMARFGYLLLREGRWAGKEVVPAQYVHHCGRASPYNPHSPYSLQFDVNTDGHMPGYPRDAFWKSGSGAHMLYVVPSLDLVVWKLAGRDAQYGEADTGIKPDPAAVARAADRRNWQPTLGEREGQQELLRKVIAAIVN